MINRPDENIELASREEILVALVKFTSPLNEQRLRGIQEDRIAATSAEKYAAKAILACIDAVSEHGGLDLSSAIQRIYSYSLVPDPVREIYEIAYTPDPALPTFPTKTEDVYTCLAILYAMNSAGVRL